MRFSEFIRAQMTCIRGADALFAGRRISVTRNAFRSERRLADSS